MVLKIGCSNFESEPRVYEHEYVYKLELDLEGVFLDLTQWVLLSTDDDFHH